MTKSGSKVFRDRKRSVFIVTTKDGRAFRGVLFDFDKRCMVLRNAEALEGSGPILVDGELLLLWADVAFLNRP